MTPDLFPWILLGTFVGIVVGATPGLTGAMAIALTLPLTMHLDSQPALALLVSMYVGSVSGGLLTATLLKMPGTPASIMTTLDAYPMAAGGRPRRALGIGIIASLIGGLASWAVLVALARPVADLATMLSPFDIFALVFLALILVVAISRNQLVLGLLSVFLGMLAAMPGLNPATGEPRLTFGMVAMHDGFKQLPVLIGLFAIAEILRQAGIRRSDLKTVTKQGGNHLSLREWGGQTLNLVRSSMIGSFVGVLPGIGANIGSLLAYGAAKSIEKDADKFGEGAESAIVASESANNATVGGALVPLIALGIPGSVIDAILLGAFVIHGLQPGPLLFENSPHIVKAITGSYLIANLVMFVLMWCGAGLTRKLIDVPRWILVPVVLTFCVIGSFAVGNRIFDVWVMLGFGALGVAMNRFGIPLAPFVLGFVLAPLAEKNLVEGLQLSRGNWLPLLQGPFSVSCLIIAAILFIVPLIRIRRGSTN